MQELLPREQAIFDQIKSQIMQVYHLHGFNHIETPMIDRTEILLAKAGGDTEKQIYKVVKTAETSDDADQALRFDHTVPLARYVVEHQNDLAFPFRVSQFGRNFRGERAQKGRFREFYQMDADIIGRNTLPTGYDAEVVATAFHALSQFVKTPILVRLSNRKILAGLLEALALTEKSSEIYGIIDHAEKVPAEVTEAKLREQITDESKVQTLLQFVQISGPRTEVVEKLVALGIDNETFMTGVSELLLVLDLLEAQGIGQSVIADMLIIRGLDYYTGTVFETILPEYKNLGSICSGGRYENLASNYTEEKFPGVGISIGLTRLFYCLSTNNLLESYQSAPVAYCVVSISDAEIAYAYQVVAHLINQGASADLCLLDKKLGDKIKYAAKVAENVIIIGENEVKDRTYQVKNLTTGEQKAYELK